MITLYGISNCDTVKKAKKWLDAHEVNYAFHDFRKHGLDEAQLRRWINKAGWEILLNRRGTTWRKLTEDDKQDMDGDKALQLMLDNVTLIKRPVLVRGNTLLVGFDEQKYNQLIT
jgi:arsenate reductase